MLPLHHDFDWIVPAVVNNHVSRNLNILLVSDVSITSVIGGAERVLLEQSKRLSQRGHEVHILTRKLPTHQSYEEIIQGVREWRYDVDQKSIVSFIKSVWRNGRRQFESLHNKYNFDCINFHQPFSSLCVIHSPVSQKIKKIYTCHSLSFEEFISRNSGADSLLDKAVHLLNIHARKWIEKRVLRKSDQIIVLSEFTLEKIWNACKIPPQKVSIIPGGVDLKTFYSTADKIEIRQRLHIPPEKVVLFSVRNLVPRMGLENLIIAITEVVKTARDIYLVLGGEGPLRDDLIALTKKLGVENFITFTGFIPEEELPNYYRIADLFVLPTKELEGFGLVTLEAMASGVPVLGTPVGGTKEILGKFDPDFLLKDSSPGSIAGSIIELYHRFKENPEDWKALSHQCRRFVESNYSWEKNVDCLEKMFGNHSAGSK